MQIIDAKSRPTRFGKIKVTRKILEKNLNPKKDEDEKRRKRVSFFLKFKMNTCLAVYFQNR